MTAVEMKVCSVPPEVPARGERAKWLADLSNALNEAHDLLLGLNLQGERRADAFELHLRIEAARLEVQSLRLSRSLQPRQEPHPNWTELQPWGRAGGNDR
jgi:hypothetical protein